MAQFAAFLSLSSASCFLGQPRLSFSSVRLKATALPLRLHAGAIRCHVEDLSPKELQQIRKKEALKKLRKIRKERRVKRRAEELAKIPQVRPNPAILRFERPLLNWNKPWRKKKVSVAKNQNENPNQGLGFGQGKRWIHTPEVEASSSLGLESNSELPDSLWTEFDAIYEEKMKLAADGITDVSETRNFEAASDRISSNTADRIAHSRLEHNERYSKTKVVGEGRDWPSGGELNRTWCRDSNYPKRGEFLSARADSRRSSSQSPSRPIEDIEASEVWGNREKLGDERFDRDVPKNRFEDVVREERIDAGKTSTREVPRIVVGQRKGRDVYLSIGDEDATVKKELRRSDVDEGKQLEWLAKQLVSVARPDGVHLSRVIRSGGLKMTDGRAVILVQKLGELGNWRCALQFVEWLNSRNRFPPVRSRYLSTTLLAVLRKARQPIESLKVFEVMREHVATYPDMTAYRIIAVTLGQAAYLEELIELMQTLRHGPDKDGKYLPLVDNGRLIPDVVIYNAALNACVSHKHWRLALWILDQMHKEKDVRPNSASYGLAIEVLVKAGKFDLAWKILGKMELGGFHPNSLTYKALVEGLGQVGRADLAVQMVRQMEERGIVAVPGVYYELASTLCICGKWQDAILQVDRIGSLSGRPLVQTYTGLIKACKESGRWRDAISVFEHMREVCAPNIGTCNIMISLYGAHRMYAEAKNLFDQIKKGRISPPKLYKGDLRLSPDAFTYDAMLGACANAEKWEDLEVLFRQMVLQGYQLSSNRHAWIMQALSAAGKDGQVAAMFSHLKSLNVATAELYVLMIKSCLSGGEQEKAFSQVEEMVNLNLRISSSDLQNIERVSFLLSEEDRLNFMNKVENLKNRNDFNFAKDSRLVSFHRQPSSAFKPLKSKHSVLNTRNGSREGMNYWHSIQRSLENTSRTSLALESSQQRSFYTTLSQDWPSEVPKEDHRNLRSHSDDLQRTLISSDIPGWELLWKRSSQRQTIDWKSDLIPH